MLSFGYLHSVQFLALMVSLTHSLMAATLTKPTGSSESHLVVALAKEAKPISTALFDVDSFTTRGEPLSPTQLEEINYLTLQLILFSRVI